MQEEDDLGLGISAIIEEPDGTVAGGGLSSIQGSDSRASNMAAVNRFSTVGDHVHYSSNAPQAMSGHGWWVRHSGPATTAQVTIQIQQHWGGWVNVGPEGHKTGGPGSGSGKWAVGRAECTRYPGRTYTYRSIVDVDLVGYADSSEKLVTPMQNSDCSAKGKVR